MLFNILPNLLKHNNFLSNELISNVQNIKKNKSYIFHIFNYKIYYTIHNKTPKKDGYCVNLYKIENKLSTP